jgi:hypothetical protein
MLVVFCTAEIVYICVIMTCSPSYCPCGTDPRNVCVYICMYMADICANQINLALTKKPHISGWGEVIYSQKQRNLFLTYRTQSFLWLSKIHYEWSKHTHDYLFNLFAATLHIGGHRRNLRTCHDVVTGTHLFGICKILCQWNDYVELWHTST